MYLQVFGMLRTTGVVVYRAGCSQTRKWRGYRWPIFVLWARWVSGPPLGSGRGTRPAPRDGARELERLGFEMLWIGGSRGQIEIIDAILGGTERLVAATGITQIWMNPASEVAADYHHLNDTYSGRFVLGLGVGHAPFTTAAGLHYQRPLAKLRSYLDQLDQADRPVPKSGRVIAALRAKALGIAAEPRRRRPSLQCAAGAHGSGPSDPWAISGADARAEDPLRYGPVNRPPGRPGRHGYLPELA